MHTSPVVIPITSTALRAQLKAAGWKSIALSSGSVVGHLRGTAVELILRVVQQPYRERRLAIEIRAGGKPIALAVDYGLGADGIVRAVAEALRHIDSSVPTPVDS